MPSLSSRECRIFRRNFPGEQKPRFSLRNSALLYSGVIGLWSTPARHSDSSYGSSNGSSIQGSIFEGSCRNDLQSSKNPTLYSIMELSSGPITRIPYITVDPNSIRKNNFLQSGQTKQCHWSGFFLNVYPDCRQLLRQCL